MPGCAVYGCKSYSRITKGTGIKYYTFPKTKEMCKKWVQACCRKDKFNIQNARICSKHFTSTDFEVSLKSRLLNYTFKTARNIKPDAVPTEFLPNKTNTLHTARNERGNRRNKKINGKNITNAALKTPENLVVAQSSEIIKEEIDTCEIITDLPSSSKDESPFDVLIKMEEKINVLEQENASLKIQNETLQKENNFLNSKLLNINEILNNPFTPSQI